MIKHKGINIQAEISSSGMVALYLELVFILEKLVFEQRTVPVSTTDKIHCLNWTSKIQEKNCQTFLR